MWHFGNSRRGDSSSKSARGTALKLSLAIVTAAVAGCGGGSPATQPQADSTPSKPSTPSVQTAAVDHAEKRTATKTKKESGIPYDAFFDNPLEVADNKAVVGGAASPVADKPAAMEKPAVDTPTATGGALAWTELMPTENLQAEVKKTQNRLKAALQSQGTYNGNYKEIVVDGAVIAALAGIAIEHGGDMNWKKNAPVIREVGYELSQAAAALGKDNYEKSKAAYEKLESIFSGSVPADAPTAAPTRPFHEIADRGGLMKRIERARNHLRDNINTEAKLKADTEGIVHETLLISGFGKIIALEGYSSADEEEYQKFAEALISGAKEATDAAKDQSFQKFTDAMNKVNKSCDQCHADYGNG